MKRFLKRIAYIFKYRFVISGIVFGVLFAILIAHLFNLQIIKGSEYRENLTTSIEKVVSTSASRGRIFDRNGELLAYDELAYAVNISDSGIYTDKKEKNEKLNDVIIKTLRIIKDNGDTYSNDFDLEYEDGRGYYYNVSGDSLLKFLRDCLGVASVSELTEEQKRMTAGELARTMAETYMVDTESLTQEELLELLYLRMNMTANSYNRYRTFTIASEVSDDTMAQLLESSNELIGVTVDEKYVRRYNDPKYFSAVLGYTGRVSREQLEELQSQDESYEGSDFVGKGGVEESFENVLAGQKGQKTVYLDTVGHITEVLSETESVAGNDVYLTIDSMLQKRLYEILENKLTDIIIEHLRSGGEKIAFTSEGVVSDIYILMPEVYYALLRNNLVSVSSLQNPKSNLEKEIYDKYLKRRDEAVRALDEELSGEGTLYQGLSDDMKAYVWRAYEVMLENGVLMDSSIDTEDEKYKEWISGWGMSFREFIEYSITHGWIDYSRFSDEQYTDLNGMYSVIKTYISKALEDDRTFALNIYEYLLQDGELDGRKVCELLYDQGFLDKDDNLYDLLSSGNISGQDYIENALRQKIITPGELGLYPSSGGAIVTDPYTGQLLALVSYPGYDNNKLTGDMDTAYYNKLQYNSASPMLNWATQAKCAPGSIFKLCTSITAMDTGAADPSTEVYCTGIYGDVMPSPRCWIFPGKHGTENMATAIRDSCNVYFYTMGNKIASVRDGIYDSEYGTGLLEEYAKKLGLATKSGVEISEAEPQASNTNAISSAIGQGTASFSCINIARYVSTIVTEGTCYNSNLILKTTDRNGEILTESEPVIAGTMDKVKQDHWNTVKYGMLLATDTYEALEDDTYGIACKTGTSQPSLFEPDNATYVSFAPYSDPEITLSIEVPFGYTSIYNTEMAASFYSYYFNDYKYSDNDDSEDEDDYDDYY